MANDYRYPGIIDVAVNYDDIDLNVVSIPGEGGSPIYTLTRCEAALLVARAFVTYGSIALYCFTYTTLRFGSSCLTQDNAASTDVVYLVHGIMLFTMIAAAFTICVDLRFLWIVRRHRSRQALDQRVVELFPSPLFILYYAYTRGDGFGANSREPAMVTPGAISISTSNADRPPAVAHWVVLDHLRSADRTDTVHCADVVRGRVPVDHLGGVRDRHVEHEQRVLRDSLCVCGPAQGPGRRPGQAGGRRRRQARREADTADQGHADARQRDPDRQGEPASTTTSRHGGSTTVTAETRIPIQELERDDERRSDGLFTC